MSSKSTDSPAGRTGPFAEYGLFEEDEDARLVVVGRIIHATWDIAPNPDGDTLRPYVYWKTDHVAQCACALIKRCVIIFMSYFMYVFCPILLLTNIKWDIKAITHLLISAFAHPMLFFGPSLFVYLVNVVLMLHFVGYPVRNYEVTFALCNVMILFLWQP